jgi:hypothetical protein
MIKLVALLKKRDDITREQFIAHYENSHVPLIHGFFAPYVVEYTRTYLDHGHPLSFCGLYGSAEPFPGSRYDVVTTQVFRNQEDLDAFYQAAAAPGVGEAIAADEAKFLDSRYNQCIIMLEHHSNPGGKAT